MQISLNSYIRNKRHFMPFHYHYGGKDLFIIENTTMTTRWWTAMKAYWWNKWSNI